MQGLGTVPDALFEDVICMPQREVGMPFAAQGRGQLATLHGMKRFLEKEDAVCRRDLAAEIFRILAHGAGHDDDIDVRIDLADQLRGPDAVNPRRHANIEEHDRERAACIDRFLHGGYGRFSLLAGADFEPDGAFFVRFLAEKYFLEVAQCRGRRIRLEILAEAAHVFADDHRIVIDDEDTVGRGLFLSLHEDFPSVRLDDIGHVLGKLHEGNGLVEVMQSHRGRDAPFEFLSRYIRISGDEHDFDIRIQLADLAAGLDTVDARRHAHVEDHDIEWVTVVRRFPGDIDRVIALLAGNDIELRRVYDIGLLIEQLSVQRVERFHVVARVPLTERLSVTFEDVFIVVRDQDADGIILMGLCIHN